MVIHCKDSAQFLSAQKDLIYSGFSWKHGAGDQIINLSFIDMDDVLIHYSIDDLTMTWSRLNNFDLALSLACTLANHRALA
jgi:hypothetical protein